MKDATVIDTDLALVRAAWRVGLAVGVPATLLAWWLRDGRGALTALGAVLLVVGGFGVSGLTLRWASRRGPTTVQAAALGGMLVRFWLYGLLVVTLSPTDLVDGPTLALTAPLALLVLLAVEVRLVLTRREFWMLHPAPADAPPKTSRTNA